ncbi:MAG TPA: hypothetical protein VK157_02220 [Phycisphaerales bacterium]|nr:hypothetical protein [Phycisphaerales bacterium]
MPYQQDDRVIAARDISRLGVTIKQGTPGIVRSVVQPGSYSVAFDGSNVLIRCGDADLRAAPAANPAVNNINNPPGIAMMSPLAPPASKQPTRPSKKSAKKKATPKPSKKAAKKHATKKSTTKKATKKKPRG